MHSLNALLAHLELFYVDTLRRVSRGVAEFLSKVFSGVERLFCQCAPYRDAFIGAVAIERYIHMFAMPLSFSVSYLPLASRRKIQYVT